MSLFYEDEYVELHHGDCRAVRGWTRADVLVTDPPYGIGWKLGENRAAKSKRHDGILNDDDTSARDTALELWGDRPSAVFGSWRAPFPADVRQTLVWRKPKDAGVVGSTTGFRNDTELIFLRGGWPKRTSEWSSVLETDTGMHTYLNGHPHSKPVALIMRLIDAAPPGVIADPFAGSGSTLIAARNLGRKAIGVEVEERYCDLIVKRLSQQAFDFTALEGAS